MPPASRQPYVGTSAFAHKAGLHASAIKVDPDLYQHLDPIDVGNDMRLLVSDMAGRASIELKGRELGFELDPELAKRVTDRVKELEPGFHWLIPLVHGVKKTPVRSVTIHLPSQKVMTVDVLVYDVSVSVVAARLTVTVAAAEVLLAKPLTPKNEAVSEWVPTNSYVGRVARPEVSSGAEPSTVVPSKKKTVPIGVPVGEVTVAVSVSICPKTAFAIEELSVVVVGAAVTGAAVFNRTPTHGRTRSETAWRPR